MKYRTRKLIEHIIDTVILVIVAVSVGYMFMKMRNLNVSRFSISLFYV